MESGLVMLQTGMPLLAVRLGASWIALGTIGWVAQAIRTPICFTSGHLSERVGRAAINVPAALICAVMIFALSRAQSIWHVMVLYCIAMAAIGAFYPPLQAMIGDVSPLGQLRKNLGMFNVGWCVGGALTALAAGLLVASGLSKLFCVGAACCAMAALLVVTWRAKHAPTSPDPSFARRAEKVASPPVLPPDVVPADIFPPYKGGTEGGGGDFGPLLLISRIGHFAGFFGFSMIRILFPKLGINEFGWSEAAVAKLVAVFLWGLAVGILGANLSPWWRGKIWPQAAAQLAMLACAVGVALVCSPTFAAMRAPSLIGALFFVYGMAQSICYTGALYYGLSSRKGKGTNTGIHEALVSSGCVLGCLIGGIVAEKISVVAPFIVLAGVVGVGMLATAAVWARRPALNVA